MLNTRESRLQDRGGFVSRKSIAVGVVEAVREWKVKTDPRHEWLLG